MKVFHRLDDLLKFIKIYAIMALVPLLTKASCHNTPGIPNPIKACTFSALIRDITQIVLTVGLPLAALMIIYSGFLFVTAQGNEEQLKKAKQNFYWAIIGAAVIIGARVIAEAVVNFAESLG